MRWIEGTARTIAVNVAIILMLIGLLGAGPIAVVKAYDAFRIIKPAAPVVLTVTPDYDGIAWAEQYFSDHKGIGSTYADYVVWELDPLASETINIDEHGRRRSVAPGGFSTDEIWMFGGSTVFGTGVVDAATIPSLLAERLGRRAVNFGQDNYVARQNVIRLLREYEGLDNTPSPSRTVIFYDGVNDVHVKCRVENLDLVTDQQDRIRAALSSEQAANDASPLQLLRPALVLLDKLRERGLLGSTGGDPDSLYVCDDNADRADRVAHALVSDWRAAQAITEANGDEFIAVLQPVSYLSDTRLDHLPPWELDAELAEQYETVYPLVRSYAQTAGIRFHDLTGVFDHDEFLYLDFCHVSPNGNSYMAEALADILD